MDTIDNYLAALKPADKAELERIRQIVRQTMPDAVELISYKMPTFKYQGRPLIYFAAFKDHLSIFPASGSVIEQLGGKLTEYKKAKGTLSFSADKPIPESVIRDMLHLRLAEITGR